jgi:endo-1,3(4)-beta-glucanase
MRARYRRVVAAVILPVLLPAAACTSNRSGNGTSAAPAADGVVTEAAGKTSIGPPKPGGKGGIATGVPAGMAPTKPPGQAGEDLAGQALPTNQWWTSALTGPFTQPIWAHPLTVQATGGGLQVSSAPPAASPNSVITPFAPAVTAGGATTGVRVTGYGAFHVVLRAQLQGGGTMESTVVQGSPLLYLRFQGAEPVLTLTGAGQATVDQAVAHLTVAGQRWDLLSNGGTWRQDGNRLTAAGAGDGRVALARVPDRVDQAAWNAVMVRAAGDPVVQTSATMAYDQTAGTVTQTLTARRQSGRPGVWALLPHQQSGLVKEGTTALAGGYPDALGTLSLVEAPAIRVRVPMPGLLTGAPSVTMSAPARAAVSSDLDQDLAAKVPADAGGSYFGLKELGRLATIAQVAQGVGAKAQRQQALDRLRPRLEDWLTYSGDQDARYFAYDKTWGGLIAVPAEFGSNDYNDHHFQYGYLVRAAAVLAESDPAFLHDYRDMVNLVVEEYSGELGTAGVAGFPSLRVFNAYLGHSAASGFAPFADGNNQESSSEAVAAWEAVVRWGLVSGQQDLVKYGVTHYAMESATARMYWLGQGLTRPAGYAHDVAGIVWDAKIDYATFFDPKPESVEGIQLLPLTFGSLYRADTKSAADREARLARTIGGAPRVWGDLFAADLAATDPTAARSLLAPSLPREDSTSRAMVRYYVEMLAAFGAPQPAVTADAPYGMAFGSADRPTLALVNPTSERRTVTFRSGAKVVATISVDPHQSVSRNP